MPEQKPIPNPMRRIEFKEHRVDPENPKSELCKGSGKKIETDEHEPYNCPVCEMRVAVYMTVLE